MMMNTEKEEKPFINQYRTGVKIGNYTEDIFGKELTSQHLNQHQNPKMYISEQMDRYMWPKPSVAQLSVSGNEITKPYTSNYDLNVVMSKNNSTSNPNANTLSTILNPLHDNCYLLEDKNKFLLDEIRSEDNLRRLTMSFDNTKTNDNIHRETQNILNKYHINDTSGIFNTKKRGLANHLLLSHAHNQRNFKQSEYASTYDLTINRKETTASIYNSKYHVMPPQQHFGNKRYDDSDWGFRKYRIYDEFTHHFDRSVNNLTRK